MRSCPRHNLKLLLLTALIGVGIFGYSHDTDAKSSGKTVQKKAKPLVFDEKKYEQGLSDVFVRVPSKDTIYWIAPFRRMYYLPNPGNKILKSWHGDKTPDIYGISQDILNRHSMAGPLPPRAGTYLIKFSNDPTVYAVEPKAMLRPIKDEMTAAKFYGPGWNKRVMVLNPETKKDFIIGEMLEYDSFPPEGTLVRKTGDGNIYWAKWGHLVLLTRDQWNNCKFSPKWIIEGEWNYPEAKPYKKGYASTMLDCDIWDQAPKLLTGGNTLAQKKHLRVLNAEFIENTEDKRHIEFFKAFNSLEKRPSIYNVRDWYLEQYKKYGRELTMDFDIVGPFKLPLTYNEFLGQGKPKGFLHEELESVTEDLLKKSDVEPGFYDIINLIFFDDRNDLVGVTAVAGSGGRTWISAYSVTSIGYTNDTIAHEMGHLLGAEDLHQGSQCHLPDLLADPYQKPLYPQEYRNVMCNDRVLDINKAIRESDDLSNTILGESVLRDFGWK